MMGEGWFGPMVWFGGFPMLFGVLFWAGLVAVLVWGATALFGRGCAPEPTPLEILRRRYARGDITEAEYEQTRKAIG